MKRNFAFEYEALPSQITASHSHWDEFPQPSKYQFMAADRRLFGVCCGWKVSTLDVWSVCVCRFCPSFLHRCPLIQFILHHCLSILPDNEPVCLPFLSSSNSVIHLATQTQAYHKYHRCNQWKYSFSTINSETVIHKSPAKDYEGLWSTTYKSVHEKE